MLISSSVVAGDNEIFLTQSGDTLQLTIEQVGYGNRIGGTDFSGTPADMDITGSGVDMTVKQTGNLNILFGPLITDNSTINLEFTGDSNVMDWNIGYGGSTDVSDINMAFTGSSNTLDVDLGYDATAERMDIDFLVLGDSNNFVTKIDSDDATLNLDIDGSYNDFNTNQKDGGDHIVNIEYAGSSGDIDIIQQSGTCPVGQGVCSGKIDLDITSSNATINIHQRDTAD
jgi:hypothetical protein